jgi:hypothetical protein
MTFLHLRSGARIASAVVVVGMCGCNRTHGTTTHDSNGTSAMVTSHQPPLDRLSPGELAESSQLAFGFPVPKGMRIDRAFPDAVHLVGEVPAAELVSYVQKHAQVNGAELAGKMMHFDHVRIPSQKAPREYSFDVVQTGQKVQLIIKDVTPRQTEPGLSDEERWRQAGLKPNGEALDVSDLR